VTVVNTEERTFGPLLSLPGLWLNNVQDNTDSILVVVSHKALVSISCVCSHDAVPFEAELSSLVVRDLNSHTWLQRKGVLFVAVAYHLVNVRNGH
jgi:hypothetical protein